MSAAGGSLVASPNLDETPTLRSWLPRRGTRLLCPEAEITPRACGSFQADYRLKARHSSHIFRGLEAPT